MNNKMHLIQLKAKQLIDEAPEQFQFIAGNLEAVGLKPMPPETASQGHTVIVSSAESFALAVEKNAGLILATRKCIPKTLPDLSNSQALLSIQSVPHTLSVVNRHFDQHLENFPHSIHPTALVHPSAKIGKNVGIGAFTSIGENVLIGDSSKIGSQVVIENNVIVGRDCLIHPFVFIGSETVIGNGCELHVHCSIGSDGFGVTKTPDGLNIKIPQIGRVILEDNVELGAHCAVDRATLHETRIGTNSKLDNFCHIAHNCRIGKNAVIAARFTIAGSSVIGDNFMAGGEASVTDHVNIGNNVILGGRTGVTKDLPHSGAYTGYPCEPIKDGLRTLASLPSLSELRKQVTKIGRELKHLQEKLK